MSSAVKEVVWVGYRLGERRLFIATFIVARVIIIMINHILLILKFYLNNIT